MPYRASEQVPNHPIFFLRQWRRFHNSDREDHSATRDSRELSAFPKMPRTSPSTIHVKRVHRQAAARVAMFLSTFGSPPWHVCRAAFRYRTFGKARPEGVSRPRARSAQLLRCDAEFDLETRRAAPRGVREPRAETVEVVASAAADSDVRRGVTSAARTAVDLEPSLVEGPVHPGYGKIWRRQPRSIATRSVTPGSCPACMRSVVTWPRWCV